MKERIKLNYYILLVAVPVWLIMQGCNDTSDTGLELLPSTDLINIKSLAIGDDISAYTHREDSVKSDEGSKTLIGSINDPVFGNTTIDMAAQFRLLFYPDYGENAVADSVKLFLYYRYLYGDTSNVQTIRIYELEAPLDVDQTYYHEVDLKSMASDNVLAEYSFKPQVKQDSTTSDTLYQLLIIPLDISLGHKLVNADSLDVINNEIFLNFFKGLYIETEKRTQEGGTIISLEAASNDEFQGSALAVYYNNDKNRIDAEPDTLMMPYVISEFSARVNRFTHDYSGTAFVNLLNNETTEDSLIYLQSTGGLQSKIYIDNLISWRDSAVIRNNDTISFGINKAELVFQVDTVISDVKKYPPPSQLLFTVINDEGGEYLPVDYVFSPAFYGGYLRTDYTYRFNVTQHIQQIIEGKVNNNGFYLTTARKNSEANRVVLKGSSSKTGIKLIVTYSRFLQ